MRKRNKHIPPQESNFHALKITTDWCCLLCCCCCREFIVFLKDTAVNFVTSHLLREYSMHDLWAWLNFTRFYYRCMHTLSKERYKLFQNERQLLWNIFKLSLLYTQWRSFFFPPKSFPRILVDTYCRKWIWKRIHIFVFKY